MIYRRRRNTENSEIFYFYRLVLRIRADAAYSHFPLGDKFGCNPDTEGPNLIQMARTLGLNVCVPILAPYFYINSSENNI